MPRVISITDLELQEAAAIIRKQRPQLGRQASVVTIRRMLELGTELDSLEESARLTLGRNPHPEALHNATAEGLVRRQGLTPQAADRQLRQMISEHREALAILEAVRERLAYQAAAEAETEAEDHSDDYTEAT